MPDKRGSFDNGERFPASPLLYECSDYFGTDVNRENPGGSYSR